LPPLEDLRSRRDFPILSRCQPGPMRTPADVLRRRSTAVSAKSSRDPMFTRPARCVETAAASGNRPLARQCPVRCRCPQKSRSSSAGNRSPEPATADPAFRDTTSDSGPRRSGQIPTHREPGSAADKKDALALPAAHFDAGAPEKLDTRKGWRRSSVLLIMLRHPRCPCRRTE
jgi:hypothetical protein